MKHLTNAYMYTKTEKGKRTKGLGLSSQGYLHQVYPPSMNATNEIYSYQLRIQLV